MVRIDWTNTRVQAVLLKWAHEPERAARYLGCSKLTVIRALYRFGWAPPQPPRQPIDWAPWDRYLGTVSDQEVARLMSRTLGRKVWVSTVRDRRCALNVPALFTPFGRAAA